MPNVGPPRRMGGWQLHTLIARSISGSVWAGLDIQTGQTVAVKLFNRPPIAVAVPGTTTDHPWEFLSGLNHPGIVKILSHGCENGQHYAVMEFSTQGNLKNTLFPGQKQTIFHAVIWTRQILAALDHLHQQGYVHLDIKPENILLFPDDCVKICDFGLMRPIAAPASVPMGTPGFMSPEQIMGQSLDRRSDLFSLGAVFYRWLTGYPAFVGNSTNELLHHTLLSTPPWPSHIHPDIPQSLSHCVMRALEKRPSRRFVDASSFIQTIDESSIHGCEK